MHCTLDARFDGNLIFPGTFPSEQSVLHSAQRLLTAFERAGKAIKGEGKREAGLFTSAIVAHGRWEKRTQLKTPPLLNF